MEQEKEEKLPWETARVVFGRLIGINKNASEITIETKGDDDEWFEEDYDLPRDFPQDQFEELIDYLDLDIRVVLLDSTVVKIVRGGRLR
ncbi:MAG: hypothetical protein O2U62_03795 [Candidatus Bathyarchaeota archaeon]|nr:hypothetical protein [Candidatus Bathyarchaeota archaeon]